MYNEVCSFTGLENQLYSQGADNLVTILGLSPFYNNSNNPYPRVENFLKATPKESEQFVKSIIYERKEVEWIQEKVTAIRGEDKELQKVNREELRKFLQCVDCMYGIDKYDEIVLAWGNRNCKDPYLFRFC